jgi:LmbE family N-acetylglucosaminyl deacetylase
VGSPEVDEELSVVSLLFLTSGDGFEWDAVLLERTASPGPRGMRALGVRRMAEARRAATILGVPEEQVHFLGYPDRGLLRLFLHFYIEPYRSAYTGVASVPYPDTVTPGASYTGRNLERDFRSVVGAVDPTIVLAPSPLDTHPDHQATAYLAMRLFGERDEIDRVHYWILHGGLQWPRPKGWHRRLPLAPPPVAQHVPWRRVDLTAEQIVVKEAAIRAHDSQMQILFRYMSAFVRTNELISPMPLAVP